ncbi:MAG: 5-methyltetrahydropteroyltriglutamate--homocysteine methyltransferase [Pseudorhodoplanes sp.]|nr:5-methyltetrahydropteroyltriglutamate--homocysteine methyltransferase [Pseudorhodoplanes sp.]GIK79126.1 MAG: methionine synthase [Alphaproteobacteria bacterium]
MKRSTERILTTHVGSLPRPPALLDLMKAHLAGEPVEPGAYDASVRAAVAESVRLQADAGIDVVTDGEMSKPGFFAYVNERLEGFEPRPGQGPKLFAREIAAFPDYYEDYFKRAMMGGSVAPIHPMFCVGPVRYRGEAALRTDIANLKAALAQAPHVEAFMPAVAPSGVGQNAYYKSEQDYLVAVGEALRTEYLAIVEAGFVLQIDDPFLSDIFAEPDLDESAKERKATLYVETLNHSLRGISPEKIRYHTCYGINEGPRIYEADLSQVVGHMLRINAVAYSFEAANCRHEHEYHLWETVKLPDGKAIIPGVITHASNIVEHPELIAERLCRFANLVGRENVLAAPDCGFSSQACYRTEVNPRVIVAKFKAMAEGARIASRRLWPRAA